MSGKFYLAVIITAVAAFLGGWLLFSVVLGDFYAKHTNEASFFLMKENMSMWALIISNLAWAFLIVWVLQKTGSTTFTRGFLTGLWISFLVMLIFDLNIYAFWNIYDLAVLLVDIIVGTLFWGLVSGLAGWIIGREKTRVLAT